MHPKLPIPEEQLIARLQSKDDKAYALLYDHYAAALLGVIVRIVKVEEEAENVLQDTFVKIWQHMDQYSVSKGRLFTWMVTIARNTAINSLRAHPDRVFSPIQNPETGVYIETAVLESPELNYIGVEETVQKLDRKLKEMIDLIYYKGYTQQEVADLLHVPLGTVKTRTRTALHYIREVMKEL